MGRWWPWVVVPRCPGGTPEDLVLGLLKCLTKAGGDFAECDVYALYPDATCCASCCCGILGCKGYVTGPGLTNILCRRW